jgi:hypothetical protein
MNKKPINYSHWFKKNPSPDEIIAEARELIKAGIVDEITLHGLKSDIELQRIKSEAHQRREPIEKIEIINAMTYLVFVLIKQGVLSEYLYSQIYDFGIEGVVYDYAKNLWESSTISGNIPKKVSVLDPIITNVLQLLKRETEVWALIETYSEGG